MMASRSACWVKRVKGVKRRRVTRAVAEAGPLPNSSLLPHSAAALSLLTSLVTAGEVRRRRGEGEGDVWREATRTEAGAGAGAGAGEGEGEGEGRRDVESAALSSSLLCLCQQKEKKREKERKRKKKRESIQQCLTAAHVHSVQQHITVICSLLLHITPDHVLTCLCFVVYLLRSPPSTHTQKRRKKKKKKKRNLKGEGIHGRGRARHESADVWAQVCPRLGEDVLHTSAESAVLWSGSLCCCVTFSSLSLSSLLSSLSLCLCTSVGRQSSTCLCGCEAQTFEEGETLCCNRQTHLLLKA